MKENVVFKIQINDKKRNDYPGGALFARWTLFIHGMFNGVQNQEQKQEWKIVPYNATTWLRGCSTYLVHKWEQLFYDLGEETFGRVRDHLLKIWQFHWIARLKTDHSTIHFFFSSFLFRKLEPLLSKASKILRKIGYKFLSGFIFKLDRRKFQEGSSDPN